MLHSYIEMCFISQDTKKWDLIQVSPESGAQTIFVAMKAGEGLSKVYL